MRNPWGYSSVGLAVVTALLLLSGGTDVGGLVLISAGLYALWSLAQERFLGGSWQRAASAGASLAAAWLLAFLVTAPFLLPLFEYDRTGARMQARAAGSEERPPVGLSALAEIVLPDVDGTDRVDVLPMKNGVESASGACAGLLALLWLAPLAWSCSGLRRETLFFFFLAVAGSAWVLDLPGFVSFFRIRPFNMFSYNRWVFATADAVLILAAIGMESVLAHPLKMCASFAIPTLLTAFIGAWCLFRAFELPEPLRGELETAIRLGRGGEASLEALGAARQQLSICYGLGAVLSLAAGLGWLATCWKRPRNGFWGPALAVLLPMQLFWFAWQERRQADRTLFPPCRSARKTGRIACRADLGC